MPPFERDHPPIDPPAGCVNRLMWQIGRRLFADHQPGPDGFCQVCRPYQFYPCVGRQLADLGPGVGVRPSSRLAMAHRSKRPTAAEASVTAQLAVIRLKLDRFDLMTRVLGYITAQARAEL